MKIMPPHHGAPERKPFPVLIAFLFLPFSPKGVWFNETNPDVAEKCSFFCLNSKIQGSVSWRATLISHSSFHLVVLIEHLFTDRYCCRAVCTEWTWLARFSSRGASVQVQVLVSRRSLQDGGRAWRGVPATPIKGVPLRGHHPHTTILKHRRLTVAAQGDTR